MLFAGLAGSAAFDLLSLLQPAQQDKQKGGTGITARPSFTLPDLDSAEAASTQSQAATTGARSDSLSTDALGTLLSAQGQAQAAHHKKRSMGVLLDLLKSSQDGSVKKSDFDAAVGEGDKDSAADLFARVDQNHDNSVSINELTNFLDTYRRNSEAGAVSKGRTLAVAA